MALLYATGRLSPLALRWLAAIALLFLSVRLAVGGKPLVALLPALGGLVLLWTRHRRKRPSQRAQTPVEAAALARARALLEVGPEADAEAIRAAHRRLMERVHPDKGGSAALAAQVNEARDILLAALAEEPKAPPQ